MKIFATFANRKYDPDVVELIDAWDEFSADENYSGYEASRKAAIESWGGDLLRWVTVEIDVPAAEIYAALDPRPAVQGSVTDTLAATDDEASGSAS